VSPLLFPDAPRRRPEHGGDEGMRRGLDDFLHAKGPGLRAPYAVLCIVGWLEDAQHRAAVSPADVRALYPRGPGLVAGPLRDAASQLRRASDEGLLDVHDGGSYRLTALGRAVVEVLPDGARVGAITGRRSVSCATATARTWRRT
jgi:hypothetical protein